MLWKLWVPTFGRKCFVASSDKVILASAINCTLPIVPANSFSNFLPFMLATAIPMEQFNLLFWRLSGSACGSIVLIAASACRACCCSKQTSICHSSELFYSAMRATSLLNLLRVLLVSCSSFCALLMRYSRNPRANSNIFFNLSLVFISDFRSY